MNFVYSIIYVYLCNVVNITQFPIYASEEMRKAMGGQNVWREMNLIPFKETISNFSAEALLNILMAMPLGFGLPFIDRCSWKKITLAGSLLGVLCEAGQFLSALWAGFTFRHVNIDDVILNLVGTLLGYALFKVFKILFKGGVTKLKPEMNVFLHYIACICDEKSKKQIV